MTTTTINVQPGALLVSAPAGAGIEELNGALGAYGLYLPIEPLERGLALAELIARNAGGRRRLRHGTIARYLRAAMVLIEPQSIPARHESPALPYGPLSMVLGGPTLKRATGYGLNRALAGSGFDPGGPLAEVTFNVRPLPAARHAVVLTWPDLAAACRFSGALVTKGLALSALALIDQPGEVIIVRAELEGVEAVVERQAGELIAIARLAGAVVSEDGPGWAPWEQLASQWQSYEPLTLDLSLPRLALAGFAEQARRIAARYRLELPLWGDLGLGTLHLRFTTAGGAPPAGVTAGEAAQARALVAELARASGGSRSTELRAVGAEEQRQFHYQPGISDPARSTRHAPSIIRALEAIVGSTYVRTRSEDLGTYERDASIALATGRPLAVVLPADTAEVSRVMACAAEAGLSVVTRGAGSGLAGGTTPSEGALILALGRLSRITIDAPQLIARVGAGAVTADLQRAAEAQGLFYPPDPSSMGVSTLGGNIACNAGGPRCLKYGVTADYVLGLTAVLADGRVINIGDGLCGQSPDAGLLHLLPGSEGTLAVLTEAIVRLVPLPQARRTTLAIFDRLDDSCATVEAIMAGGLLPAGLELMDETTIRAVEAYLGLGLPTDAGALLLLLADGEPEAVREEAAALADFARRGGARRVQMARDDLEEAALWRARRAVAPALARIRPNRLGEDICVPVSRIAECVRRIQAISAEHGQPIVVFGHAGDGNLHPNILFDSRDPAQVERMWRAAEAIFRVALELGGTLSGEHGIGTLKRPFMEQALGRETLALMRRLKYQFDPEQRLNPGKVLP